MKIIKTAKFRTMIEENKNRDPSNYDTKQLEMGISVEYEHTNDKEISREIAMDHLDEFPDYYTGLEEMEKKLENKK